MTGAARVGIVAMTTTIGLALFGLAMSLRNPTVEPWPTPTVRPTGTPTRTPVPTGTPTATATATRTAEPTEDACVWSTRDGSVCAWATATQTLPLPICRTPNPGERCIWDYKSVWTPIPTKGTNP